MKRNIVVSLLLVLLMIFVVSCEEPKHEHTLEKVEAVAATCTEEGTKEYYQCSVCKQTFADKEAKTEVKDLANLKTDKDPANHAGVKKVDAVESTCTEKGTFAHWHCEGCGKNYSDEKCENELESLEAPLKPHETVLVNAVAATCAEEGMKEYYQCSVCNQTFADKGATEVVKELASLKTEKDPTNHSKVNKVDAVESTCTVKGTVEHWHCEGCGKNYRDEACKNELESLEAPLKTHATELVEAVAATCAEEGMKEYYQCSVCKQTFADKEAKTEVKDLANLKTDKDPANHAGVKKVDAVESTCTEKGTFAHWHCEGCGKNYSDEKCENELESLEAPLKPHETVLVNAVAATCAEEGMKEYYQCSVCNQTFADKGATEVVKELASLKTEKDPTNHSKVNKVDAVESTCTVKGTVAHWHCAGCGKNYRDENCENELESLESPLPLRVHVEGDGVETSETYTVGGIQFPIYKCEHDVFYLDDACEFRLYKDYLDSIGLAVAEKDGVFNAVFVDGYMRLNHTSGDKVFGYESVGLYFYGKDGKQYFSRVGLTDASGSTTFDYSANKEISFNIVKNANGTLSISATGTKSPFEEISSISINPTPNEDKSDIIMMTTTGGETWEGFRYYVNPLGGSWSDLDGYVLTISDLNGDKNIQYNLDGTDYYAFPLIDSPGNNQGTLFVAWDGDGTRKIYFRNRWIFLSASDLYIKWNSGALRNDLNGFTLYHPVSAE